MPEQQSKEKGLKVTTVWLMIATALFFDTLQAFLTWIALGWVITIIAYATFGLWFAFHKMNFFSLKNAGWLGGSFIFELIPGLDAIPVFTGIVVKIVLPLKIQEVVPGADITKLDIMNRK